MEVNKRDTGHAWIVLMAAFGIRILLGTDATVASLFYLEFQESLSSSLTMIILTDSVKSFVYAIMCPVASYVVDMIGCRWTCAIGSLVLVVGYIGTTFATSVYVLWFTDGILGGIGDAFLELPSVVITAQWFNKYENFACGFIEAGQGVGILMMLPIARSTADIYTWRGAYFILGAIMFNGIALSGLFASYDKKDDHIPQDDKPTKTRPGICMPLRNRYFMFFAVITTLFYISWTSFSVIFVSSMIKKGYSGMESVIIYCTGCIALVLGRVVFPIINNLKHVNPLIVFCICALGQGIAQLGQGNVQGLVLDIVCNFNVNLFYGGATCSITPILIQIMGKNILGHAYALLSFINSIGSMLAPPFAGFIFDRTNSFWLAFLEAGSLSIVSALLTVVMIMCRGKKSADRINDVPRVDTDDMPARTLHEEQDV